MSRRRSNTMIFASSTPRPKATRPSRTVVLTAGGVARLLLAGPQTKEQLAAELHVAPVTIQKALQYLRDRGVWLEPPSRAELGRGRASPWNLLDAGVPWEEVTLGEAYRGGVLPEHERWILEGAVQTLPAETLTERKAAVANPHPHRGWAPQAGLVAAAGVARLLSSMPRTKAEMARRLGVSEITLQRALQYLRDRGAWLEFSKDTQEWTLQKTGVDWRNVTLGDAYDADLLPEHERWILQATVQSLPTLLQRRSLKIANPARLKRSLLR